jgi:spore maturation protein SpmB
MSPDQVASIKLAEIEFKRFLEQNKIDIEKINMENVQGARNMQSITRSTFPAVLSAFITLGFFGILGWMLYDDNIANSEPVLIMLGSLGAAFGAVCNFWLGSSQSSLQKNELLARR